MEKDNVECITFTLLKIIGGVRVAHYHLYAISDAHCITVANDFYERLGLIGRYYCETSTGKTFSVNK